MDKVFVPSMTWREVETAVEKKPVVLFPLGSIEQHGPHAPVGDYRMAEDWSIQAAKIAGNTIVLPVMPFGYSESFRGFPGCLTVKPQTLYSVVKEVTECVLDWGVDHLLFVNGHKGNDSALDLVGREVNRERGIITGAVAPFSCVTPAYESELYGEKADELGHGADPVASMASSLYPDDVRMDLAEKMELNGDYGPFRFVGPSRLQLEGVPVHFYQYWKEAYPNGVQGDPCLFDRELGKKMSDRVVEMLVKIIGAFRGLDTRSRFMNG